MSQKVFALTAAIPERSTYQYEVSVELPSGEPAELAQIDQIYLTLRDIRTDAIINNREGVPVLNANGGVFASGTFTMQFDEDDMPAIGDAALQPRKLTLDFRLVGGGRVTREITFWVSAMQDVSA